jgi:hypothetical protein
MEAAASIPLGFRCVLCKGLYTPMIFFLKMGRILDDFSHHEKEGAANHSPRIGQDERQRTPFWEFAAILAPDGLAFKQNAERFRFLLLPIDRKGFPCGMVYNSWFRWLLTSSRVIQGCGCGGGSCPICLLMCDKEAIEVQKILPFLSDTWPLCRIGRAVIRASQSCRQSCNKSQCPACGCRSHHSCTHAPQFSRSFPAREWGSVLQRQGACGQCP